MERKDAILSLRQVLLEKRDALRKVLSGDLVAMNGFRGQLLPGDSVDSAMDTIQETVNAQLTEVSSRALERIEDALERMRAGKFGICEGCGNNIPMERLSALPFATRCIKCQRELERQGGSSSSPSMEMARVGDEE